MSALDVHGYEDAQAARLRGIYDRMVDEAVRRLSEDVEREFNLLFERMPPDPDLVCSCCREMRARDRKTGEIVNVRLISRTFGRLYPIRFETEAARV